MPSRRVLWQRQLPAVKLVARVHDDAPGGQRPTEVLYLQVDRLSRRDLAGEDKLRYRFGRAIPALHRAAGSPVGGGREKCCPQREDRRGGHQYDQELICVHYSSRLTLPARGSGARWYRRASQARKAGSAITSTVARCHQRRRGAAVRESSGWGIMGGRGYVGGGGGEKHFCRRMLPGPRRTF